MNRRFAFWFSISLCLVFVLIGAWLKQQEAKVWCDRQWAGLALYRGGYRSWSLTFCDGFSLDRGKQVPVTIDEKKGTIRRGYHWPKYAHSDIRYLRYITLDARDEFQHPLHHVWSFTNTSTNVLTNLWPSRFSYHP